MYAGVLGEKPQKSYLSLYQQSRSKPGEKASFPASHPAALENLHPEGGSQRNFGSRPESPLSPSSHYSYDSASVAPPPSQRSFLPFSAQGPTVPQVSSALESAAFAAQHQRHSVPLLGDPARSPARSKQFYGGSNTGSSASGQANIAHESIRNVSGAYGANPKDILALQQFGLDGRSVFPAGYLKYLNKINCEPSPIPRAQDSLLSAAPPPKDYFGGQHHRVVSEMPDKFDTAGANWVNALRASEGVITENVRNNNGNNPSPRRRAIEARAGQRRSPPYSSKSRASSSAGGGRQSDAVKFDLGFEDTVPDSNENSHGNRPSGSSRKQGSRWEHGVPRQKTKRDSAAHKRWVPTESKSLNGWISGLRSDDSRASQTSSKRPHRRRGKQQFRDGLWESRSRSGRPSWLRSMQQNSHLLKHSTHSNRIQQMEQGVLEADAAQAQDPVENARVLECPFDCGYRTTMTAAELRQHLIDNHFTNDPHQMKKHEDIAKTIFFNKQQNYFMQKRLVVPKVACSLNLC
eukprot:INCI5139.7.p1 GENE.INCI5139.7~~INCI5139.7.p1  ORF type:complete len:545 (-),score=63.79 INCI5139.7:16-1572(-)